MQKVAIIGSNSYIGKSLTPFLKSMDYETVGISKSEGKYTDILMDLTSYSNFCFDFLDEVDYVIMIAAVSSPDMCEMQQELCYKINVEGTSYCIREALKRNCKVLFFSSDAVYGEDVGAPFTELSPCLPISNYGKMKNSVEMAFIGEENFKALRLSYVFSYYDKFTQYYLSCINKQITAQIFHPLYRNVICLEDLLHTVSVVMDKWYDINYSVLNVCGNELISRINIVDTINRIINKDINYSIIPMNKEFLSIRPKITNMKSLYLPTLLNNYYSSFYEKARKELLKFSIKEI